MKPKKLLLAISISIIFFSSCVTKKPYGYFDVANKTNKISYVTEAYYKKHLSLLGIGTTAAGTLAGGYIGLQAKPTITYNENGQTTNNILNVVIGTGLAYGISNLVNRFSGQGKIINITYNSHEFDEWLKKYNRKYGTDYINLREDNKVISSSVEKSYVVNDIDDARLFVKAFPNSYRLDDIALELMPKVKRENLIQVTTEIFGEKLKPETIRTIRIDYLNRSQNVVECIEAAKKFPELNADAEKKAASLCKNIQDVKYFKDFFPKSQYENAIFDLLLLGQSDIIKATTNRLIRKDIPELIEIYPDAKNVDKAKFLYISESPTYSDFKNAIKKYPTSKIESLPYDSIEKAEQINEKIIQLSDYLGWNNAIRISNSLKKEFIEYRKRLLSPNSVAKWQEFHEELQKYNWLGDVRNEYYSLAKSNIAEIEKLEAEKARQAAIELENRKRREFFEESKKRGIAGLLEFKREYPEAPELSEVKKELDSFVQDNIKFIAHTMSVARGDANWVSNVLEDLRSAGILGGRQYNLFVWGVIENTSEEILPVKITIHINVIRTAGISFLKTHREGTLDPIYYYTVINPGKKELFVTLFKNFNEGGALGTGLLNAEMSTSLNRDNPYRIQIEYLTDSVDYSVIKNQIDIKKAFITNGNIKVQKSAKEQTNDIKESVMKSIFGQDYELTDKAEMLIDVQDIVPYTRIFSLNNQTIEVFPNQIKQLRFRVAHKNNYVLKVNGISVAILYAKSDRTTTYTYKNNSVKFIFAE